METVTLLDLGPILAAVLGPMLLFVAASMRYQHLDSTKTRQLIVEASEKARKDSQELVNEAKKENRELNKQNRELIEKVRTENRELIDEAKKENRELNRQNYDLIMRNHDLIMKNSERLSDVRERLARIEGHLRISPPPEHESDNGDDAARAA